MPDHTAKTDTPVWLVTGCSTGFGRELAAMLIGRGNRVAVTARNLAQVEDLARDADGRAIALRLDVTDKAQVAEATRACQARFGRIDVLVNNAGYGYLSAVEEGEDDAVLDMFKANVFGLADMTKAVLPGMRARRQGHIVNISSMGGLTGFPGVGYYNASKFAVEGLSEALAKEVEPLGIKVLLVEPGPFRTDWAGRSLKVPKHPIADYAETAVARRERTAAYSGSQPGDPARAAAIIIKAVETANAPFRLVLGKIALESGRAKIASLKRDFDAWEAETLAADFPE